MPFARFLDGGSGASRHIECVMHHCGLDVSRVSLCRLDASGEPHVGANESVIADVSRCGGRLGVVLLANDGSVFVDQGTYLLTPTSERSFDLSLHGASVSKDDVVSVVRGVSDYVGRSDCHGFALSVVGLLSGVCPESLQWMYRDRDMGVERYLPVLQLASCFRHLAGGLFTELSARPSVERILDLIGHGYVVSFDLERGCHAPSFADEALDVRHSVCAMMVDGCIYVLDNACGRVVAPDEFSRMFETSCADAWYDGFMIVGSMMGACGMAKRVLSLDELAELALSVDHEIMIKPTTGETVRTIESDRARIDKVDSIIVSDTDPIALRKIKMFCLENHDKLFKEGMYLHVAPNATGRFREISLADFSGQPQKEPPSPVGAKPSDVEAALLDGFKSVADSSQKGLGRRAFSPIPVDDFGDKSDDDFDFGM